ncbi:hypothetical protein BT67DRAFT_397446 [Trichocladium antarcticum]|uniref:Dihydroneopterin aldolase/epimerase domain-containing protein n=1 Tax=Trichocladium antarcticum TaxID=1450529 RepID=A0AAN6UP62_9PEZI|nr:hypothetical protein BT67DRAFT_397446 [Trichocladium antarcticum]
MAPLQTAAATRALAPDPPATVRVQNLRTTLQHAGHDAWNRAHKAQPCLLSAEVSFAAPFAAASAHDRLGADTVHYGTLSKAVLGSVAAFEAEAAAAGGQAAGLEETGVRSVLARVWRDLTGLGLDGSSCRALGEARRAFLDLDRVRFLSLTVALPKASLLGEGVALTASAVFGVGGEEEGRMAARALALEISRLRVPTLVGVNANERLARQFVVATVTVDGFESEEDVYTEVEGVVVKALEESSFETLEALGTHLADHVLATASSQAGWQVHIRLEKPTAVPMADCPIVEVRATREV